MKRFISTLFIGLLTVFATAAHAETKAQGAQQPKPRLANCKDCLDAGYRRGYAAGEAAVLENTPNSSSVSAPTNSRKSVYVQAPTTKPSITMVRAQPRRKPIQAIQQSAHHKGHGHHTKAQVLDCELTDSLNRNAGPVTTIISTQKTYQAGAVSHKLHTQTRMPSQMKHNATIKHGNHYHHSAVDKADCELTDALNRSAGPVSRIISNSATPQHSSVKSHSSKHFSHGNHHHGSEVDRADCALTDALNRGSFVTRVVRKY